MSTKAPGRGWTLAPLPPTKPSAERKPIPKSAPAAPPTEEEESGETPLFRVVEDPRAERRRLKALAAAAERGEVLPTESLTELPEPTTRPPKVAAAPKDISPFALPATRDKMIVVSVPTGAKLADYEWFGIYDQCRQVQ